MASPFLNPLHAFLPPSPSVTPSRGGQFTFQDDLDAFKLDRVRRNKDDLSEVTSTLSLTLPAQITRPTFQDEKPVHFSHYLFRRTLSAFEDPGQAIKCLRQSSSNLTAGFEQEEIDTTSHDKIFSSCWLDDDYVSFGSKANRLVLYQTRHHRAFEIETIGRPHGGDKLPRLGLTGGNDDVCSGMYGMAKNPSGTLLATNGKYSCDAVIYHLPSMRPLRLLESHGDAIFTMKWLDDERLITGSRDGSVALWHVHEAALDTFHCKESNVTVDVATAPILQKWRHAPLISLAQPPQPQLSGKVRSIHLNQWRQELASLGGEGQLKLWNVNTFDVSRSIPLVHPRSAVALAYNDERQLYAIGSILHTDFYDIRLPKPLCLSAPSLDGDWGVRSVAFGSGNTVAIGGGLGRISFYDVRKGDYQRVSKFDVPAARPLPTPPMPSPDQGVHAMEEDEDAKGEFIRSEVRTGRGWFRMDALMVKQLSTRDVRHAAYTLAFDPSGTRLFVGGGPLELGLMGAYAGIWM